MLSPLFQQLRDVNACAPDDITAMAALHGKAPSSFGQGRLGTTYRRPYRRPAYNLPSFAFWSTQELKFGAHEHSSTQNLEHCCWQGSRDDPVIVGIVE